jgi:2,3-dihydroxyphenylpropionate 1,2-dioxygenase
MQEAWSGAGDVGIVGGAAVPHAPQFFTLPATEDHDQVERVRVAMARVGADLLALEPDVIVISSNDHLENFFLHCVPSFTVHCGASVAGSFAGRDFEFPVASDVALDLVRRLQAEGFDPALSHTAAIGYEFGIPLTFCEIGTSIPLVPIYVNAYVAPQPSSERCYSLGQALNRSLAAAGVRAVMMASGGLSHYPGTDRYPNPDLTTDSDVLNRMRAGNLRSLITFDDAALDRTGNVEARSWQILAGALGERVPNHFAQESSWHHDYAVLGWTTGEQPAAAELHYPPVVAARLALSSALYRLRMEAPVRRRFLDDPAAFAEELGLDADERAALEALDEAQLQKLGIHPLLAFLARLQVDIDRRSRP